MDSSFWSSLEPGTYVRIFWDGKDEYRGHSFFIVDHTGAGLLVYEGNTSKTCDITKTMYSYEDLAAKRSYVGWIFNANFNHECQYQYEANVPGSSSGHQLKCSICGKLSEVRAHTESGWYEENGKCKKSVLFVNLYLIMKIMHMETLLLEANYITEKHVQIAVIIQKTNHMITKGLKQSVME